MARDKLTEYSATASENTVCGDVNIAENSALPSDLNNFAREIMSHLKAFSDGTDAVDGISFNDSAKAQFGAGNDLQIYHDGSSSRIVDAGTGNLLVQADELIIRNAAGNETKADFNTNGACNLYYDNAVKVATTSTGIDVTGDVLADTMTLDNGSNDWQFSVSGNNLIISYGGTNKAKLDSSGNLTVVGNVTAYGTV